VDLICPISQNSPWTTKKNIDTFSCLSYVKGFVDGSLNLIPALMAGKLPYCPPASSNVDQWVRVFLKYMDQHPAKLHLEAGNMLMLALIEAFPCGK